MPGSEIEVIEHTVSVADATVTQFGFGIPLIALTHSYWSDRVRVFNDAADMTKAPYNVPTTSQLYLTAKQLKSQSPSPPSFKVGRMTAGFTQTFTLTPTTPSAASEHYKITINGTAVDVVLSPPSSAADVVTALVTAINAIVDVTATGTTAVSVTSDTANVVIAIGGISSNLALADTTAAATPAGAVGADLAAIRAADGDWYALIMLVPGVSAVAAAAAWAETERCLYLSATAASDVPSSSTTDIASVLQAANFNRTSIWWHPSPSEHLDASVAGALLPKLPGPITFSNKGLAAVTMSTPDTSQRAALKGKNADCYINIKGLGFTLWGTAASGRFLDVTVAIDWFDVQIEDRIIALLRNNDVVPYTAAGIELVRSQIYAQILEGITRGIIDGQQPFSATAPALATIDPQLKTQRILPDMKYSYVLAGAIHKVRVVGIVQV
jgi:hypothetical protein